MGIQGETWSCPHCGELILRSAVSCPACQRRLRFDSPVPTPSAPAVCPLSVEGVLRNPGTEGPWEYSVLVQVYDARGEMLSKRVVGVGAVRPGETRRFTLQVEIQIPEASTPTTASTRRPEKE